MSELLDDVDLARKEFLQILGGSVTFRDDLDSDIGLMVLGVRQPYERERTFTEHLDDAIAMLFEDRMPFLDCGHG